MKIVVAPQSFKGNLTALEVAQAIERGIRRVAPQAEVVLVPMADGGEGTVQALIDATGGKLMTRRVTGPLGEPVQAAWGILGDGATAVIEMAAASGLPLVPPDKRNPLITTTYGTGELVLAALEAGCRKLIVGIGGSATNDGGAGMAQALGARLLDARGDELQRGGAALAELARIDVSRMDARLNDCEVVVACDVTNPLCGPRGASAIYGPQKGATSQMVARLDAALSHYASIIQRDLGVEVRDLPGCGAAGGLGAGLVAFLKAKLRKGIEITIEASGLVGQMRGADLVFSGEGRLDAQTVYGKTAWGVAQSARTLGIPVIVIAGELAPDHAAVYEQGIDAALSIAPGPITLDCCMNEASSLVSDAAERAMRLVLLKGRG